MLALALFSIYFLFIACLKLSRGVKIIKMSIWDFFINVSTFLFPPIFILIFLGWQLSKGFNKINTDPLSEIEAHILSFASLTLWTNLLYFARMSDSTGIYIIMFRVFFD